jgi:hypothetical protein
MTISATCTWRVSRLVEGRGHHLAPHRALHVRHFFRPLVDQEDDQIAFRMVRRDRMGDVLQQYCLTGSRWGNNQTALPFAERCHEIDHTRRQILRCRDIEFHLEAFVWIERRQVVEVNLVADLLRVVEINCVDLQKREISLAFLRAADRPFDSIPCLQRKPADLGG